MTLREQKIDLEEEKEEILDCWYRWLPKKKRRLEDIDKRLDEIQHALKEESLKKKEKIDQEFDEIVREVWNQIDKRCELAAKKRKEHHV